MLPTNPTVSQTERNIKLSITWTCDPLTVSRGLSAHSFSEKSAALTQSSKSPQSRTSTRLLAVYHTLFLGGAGKKKKKRKRRGLWWNLRGSSTLSPWCQTIHWAAGDSHAFILSVKCRDQRNFLERKLFHDEWLQFSVDLLLQDYAATLFSFLYSKSEKSRDPCPPLNPPLKPGGAPRGGPKDPLLDERPRPPRGPMKPRPR